MQLRFLCVLAALALTMQVAPARAADFDTGQIRSAYMGCLELNLQGPNDPWDVIVRTCQADLEINTYQTWTHPQASGPIFTTYSARASCLDVDRNTVPGNDANARAIVARTCDGSESQNWTAMPDGTMATMVNGTRMYLDVFLSVPDLPGRGGHPVVAYAAHNGNANQRWNLPAPAAASTWFNFTATADPQYQNDSWTDAERTARQSVADVTMIAQIGVFVTAYHQKGLIIAGDLTQFARNDEIATYNNSVGGLADRLYDGLGNHDLTGDSYAGPLNNLSYAQNTTKLENEVRGRLRPGGVNMKWQGIPHYSWDWNGVHFIQLNLFGGDGTDAAGQIDPGGALTFLKADLAAHKARYGDRRPVILVQHYCFSPGVQLCQDETWWTSGQKAALYDAIKDENIVAILVGHWHDPSISTYETDFHDIPTFVVGSANRGRYVYADVSYNRIANTTTLRLQPSDGYGDKSKSPTTWCTAVTNAVAGTAVSRSRNYDCPAPGTP